MRRKKNFKNRLPSPIYKIFVKKMREQIKKIVEFKNNEDGN